MLIESRSKLVMIGDSITDCERARPAGEGRLNALGNGYVSLVSGLLESIYPEKHIRVVNMGNSGDNVKDLKERWETDVLNLKADWLSIMIGTNDVWRQFDSPLQTEIHVSPGEYEETLEVLVRDTQPLLKGLVLMTPFYIETNENDKMRARMDSYGKIVKKIAVKYGTISVDTQAAFNDILQHCHSSAIAWDRVHPNITGHMVLARAFLNAVGLEWVR
jgi:lysophospholipase L1-like esterase